MKDALRALGTEYDMLPPGGRVLCAVSGGPDSMCLLHMLADLTVQGGFSLHAAHFNHRLRGEESDRDEEFVRERCLEWGIPLTCGGTDVAVEAKRLGRGVEETARLLRYEFLEQTASCVGADRIATAHTADDNAETLLLNLMRGTGLQGLSGIPPRRGNIVRPLLNVTRAQVEEYCVLHGVPWVEDSTNSDETYTRNFLRTQVLPRMKQKNPRAVENLSAAAGRLRADHEYLNTLAREELSRLRCEGPEGTVVLDAAGLGRLAGPIAVRVARMAMEQAGRVQNLTAAHMEGLLDLCRSGDPSGMILLPGMTARRQYEHLILVPQEAPLPVMESVAVSTDGETVCGDTGWSILCRKTVCREPICKNPDTFFLSCAKISGALVLRPRKTGDEIKLPGRKTKTVKKLFIDEKVPLLQRESLPVLADEAGVLAVASFGPDSSRLAQVGEAALKIIFVKKE